MLLICRREGQITDEKFWNIFSGEIAYLRSSSSRRRARLDGDV